MISFEAGEVLYFDVVDSGYSAEWRLVIEPGHEVNLYRLRPYPDAFADHRIVIEKLSGDSLSHVSVYDDVAHIYNEWAIVNIEQIKKAVESGEPITIVRAPQSLVDRIENTSWMADNSIGWAAFAWPR